MDGGKHWFENGRDAMEHKEWDHGIECFSRAVKLAPEQLEYRRQKHRCGRRRHKKAGGVTKLETVKLATIRSRILTAQVRDDWPTVDQLAEDALSVDPWDAQMYAYIAQAATKAGRFSIAKYAWTAACKIDKKNAGYFRELGRILQGNGEYDEARSCFEQIRHIDPNGRLAEELISAVDVAALLTERSYGGMGTTAEAERISEAQPAMEPVPESSSATTASVADSITNHPQPNSKLVAFTTLAEQHVQRGELASALEGYRHAIELAPNNRSIRVRKEDVELAFLRGRAMDAQAGAKQNPTCDRRRATATQLASQLTVRELEILSQRVQDNPEDLLQTFRLADLYRRASRLADAVPLFQKVTNHPELCAEAQIGLGECWVRSDKAASGRQQLELALATLNREEKPNAWKLAHYWLGRLFEAVKDVDAAVNHYADILAVDFHFRDVARRIEAIRQPDHTAK